MADDVKLTYEIFFEVTLPNKKVKQRAMAFATMMGCRNWMEMENDDPTAKFLRIERVERVVVETFAS